MNEITNALWCQQTKKTYVEFEGYENRYEIEKHLSVGSELNNLKVREMNEDLSSTVYSKSAMQRREGLFLSSFGDTKNFAKRQRERERHREETNMPDCSLWNGHFSRYMREKFQGRPILRRNRD